MIYLITERHIDMVWDRMSLGLARAEFPEDLGSIFTTDDLYHQIKDEGELGFYQVESGYSGVMKVYPTKHKTFLYFYFSGKDITNPTPINYEEVDEFLMEVAKIYGCTHIHLDGRRGWERKVKHLGYALETINLFKEVT